MEDLSQGCLGNRFYFVPDINECEIDDIKCTQLCNDRDGGYDCQCYSGFDLGEDGFTCTGKKGGS